MTDVYVSQIRIEVKYCEIGVDECGRFEKSLCWLFVRAGIREDFEDLREKLEIYVLGKERLDGRKWFIS